MMYTDSNGKEWEVVGIRKPDENDLIVDVHGDVILPHIGHLNGFQPIVRPIIPEYITPTDEDAKQRPMVEVRDYEGDSWRSRKLIYVRSYGGAYRFQAVDKEENAAGWKYCRMRNPEHGK